MKTSELEAQRKAIKDLLRNTGTATAGSLELQSHWAKYVCVLSAGFIENSHELIFSKYCLHRAQPPIAKFVARTLERIQNPKTKRFIETASSFDSSIENALSNFLDLDSSLKEAIDSIMTNRHQIAHGKSTSISIARVEQYFDKSVQVLEFLENACGL